VGGLGIANYFCCLFRDLPLFPWDFASARAAAAVAGNYTFTIVPSIGVVISLAILYISAAFRFNVSFPRRALALRVVSVVVSSALFLCLFSSLQTNKGMSRFDLWFSHFDFYDNVTHDGYAAAFIIAFKDTIVSSPDGYSIDAVERISTEYPSDKAYVANSDLPNIIIVMNESLADLSTICDFETNVPVFPFLNSLQEQESKNIACGNLHVSVLGSSTANSVTEDFPSGPT